MTRPDPLQPRSPARRHGRHRRRGAALIILIAIFAITFTLAAVWGKRIVAQRHRQKRAEEQLQAEWLAEAGLRHAAARLVSDNAYDGEQWQIDANQLQRSAPAVVAITLTPVDGQPNQVQITAQARYPSESPRVQVTKTAAYTSPPTEPAS